MGNISKLTPILYEKNETNFNHNGLGKLTKLLANEIDEVLNGEFEAFFEYPANGNLADKIDNEMLIKAKPNKKDEPHVFKIYDYELDMFTKTYLIYARSKNIEDLKNNVILDVNVKNSSPTQAWNLAKNNALDPVVTTFYSDITTTSSVHWERRSLLSTIAGQKGSMIQYWGGEIKHGIDRISLFRRRGQDNVTTVRHGKNLDGLKATYSTKGLVTAIVPYYVKGDDKAVYGDVVESEYINNYPNTYYDIVEYNDEELGLSLEDKPENGYSDNTIKIALNRVAERYFDENAGKDLPSINMEISLEDISQTKEYEQFKDFEQIEIGDTITVYSKKFNININAKVRRVVYNGLTDKNELVEVGTARRSLYDDVRDDFKKVETELQEGIDHAMTSANGKNTNYHGTADPNEIGLVGQNNDNYFRTNGQLKELWVYRDGMWHLEVGDLTGEQIRAEIAEQQKKIDEAKQTADEAVGQIDTAVANAGFTSLDETISSVQSISNQAQINSGTAIDNALEAMQQASQAIDNTGSLNVRVDGVENTLSVKADKQSVDDLTGVVDSQALDIRANADGLALKANQDTVDTLAGTVQSLGTEFDVVAGQVSSRVWNADIETAIDGLEYENRNYLLLSKGDLKSYNAYNTDWEISDKTIESFINRENHNLNLTLSYDNLSEPIATDELITFSGFLKVNNEIPEKHPFVNNRLDTNVSSSQTEIEYNQDTGYFKATYPKRSYWLIHAQTTLVKGDKISIYKPKVEKGNKATDWTPAPEDTDAKINHIETEWSQMFDTFSQTVTGIDGRVTSQEQTIDSISSTVSGYGDRISTVEQTAVGLQATVASKASQSQVTQLATGLSSTVTTVGGHATQISQLSDNINLRVQKGDVLGQINIEAGTTLIQNKKIYMDADSVIFSGQAFIPGAVIQDLSADKISTGTLNAANVQIINLDFNNASGSGVDLTGRITALSGYIGGWEIQDQRLVSLGPNGRFSVIKSSGDAMLAINSPTYTGEGDGARLQITHEGMIRFATEETPYAGLISGQGLAMRLYSEGWIRLESQNTTAVTSRLIPDEHFIYNLGDPGSYWKDTYSERFMVNTVGQVRKKWDDPTSLELLSESNMYLISRNNRVRVTGELEPIGNNKHNIGTTGDRWKKVYITSGVDSASDKRLKSEIQEIPEELIELFAEEVNPKMYKMYDSWHFGYIAQDVERTLYKYALKNVGLENAKKYVDEFNLLGRGESYMSLIYTELEVIKNKEQQLKIKALEKRIEELENAS